MLVLRLALGLFLSSVHASEGPQVTVSDGVLQGTFLKTKNGRKFSGFMGIPYAEPPVGELRFQPPLPAKPWHKALDATKVHGVCPQRDVYRRSAVVEGQEDCLYLNVYTPKVSAKTITAVMIFFHGGGWLCGSGNSMWYGPEVLLDKDVVLVVTNYRLGALGFLTTGDEVVPGNNGLKDQNLALRWIRNNIEYFGGDPDSVTIFGESAGGASAQFHMLSPLSRGLFQRAILQSGTAFCTWALSGRNEVLTNSKKLAGIFNCPTDCTKEMVDCLKKVDAKSIIEQDDKFMLWDYDPMIPFKPVIEPKLDGAFLTDHPMKLITSHKYENVPIMVGLNTEDGGLKVAGMTQQLIEEFDERFDELAPMSLEYDKFLDDIDTVTKNLRKFYFGKDKIDQTKVKELIDLYTDGWFMDAADTAVRLHYKHTSQPVYFYLFGYRGSASFTKIFGGGDTDFGVCHADELQYLFPIGDGLFPDVKPSESDKKITEIMTTLWTNFAKTGDPTPRTTSEISERWKPYTAKSENYYYIDSNSTINKSGLFLDRALLWRSFTKNYDKKYIKDEL
nr:unnamed protein product [Callosobruchus chinensis]